MRTLLVALLSFGAAAAQDTQAPTPAATYDPLRVPEVALAPPFRFTVHDQARERAIPILVHLPAETAGAPVVLWSHGLGGSREMGRYLGEHWAKRGYVAVFLQHPGSDDSVWKDAPLRERMAAMRSAASAQNFVLRCEDVRAVLDQLAVWNAEADHVLLRRLDLERVGMSGHSFGAYTTQMVGGQWAPLIGQKHTDPRIDAALPMSPSSPRAGSVQRAFGKVTIPWMLMTGTEDVSPIGDQDVASRRAVHPALPAGIDRYELVLDGARHGAFTDRPLPGETRNPTHHRTILCLSTAFWDAHLRGDASARHWLHGRGAKSVLEPKDLWSVGERVAAGSPQPSSAPTIR